MEVTKIKVSIEGTRPILQNEISEEEEGVQRKGKAYDDQEEAEKRLIKDSDGTICQKAIHLESSMIKAATDFKFQGKKTYKELTGSKNLKIISPYSLSLCPFSLLSFTRH